MSKEQMPNGPEPIPTPDSESLSNTESAPDTTSRSKSTNSDSRKNDSKEFWQQPQTVRQFVSQVNTVATKVLNGQIDMDVARTYATLSRVLVQGVSVEVTRARFLKQVPDLNLDDEWKDDE